MLDLAAADRRKADAADLTAFFLSSTPLLAPRARRITTARRQLVDLQIPSTLIMGEKASFERPSYELRERGSFTARGARVYAGTPKALHAMRDDQPANRLGLARWLVDDNNPLVARVAVNRLWEQLFGRGIVETSEDFGTQGTPPSNPALLDWLATELIDERMEPEGDHPLHRDVGHLPAVLDASRRCCSSGTRITGCWRAAPGSGSTPRASATSSSR